MGVTDLSYRINHTITDSCGDESTTSAGPFLIGLSTVVDPVIDPFAAFTAVDSVVAGCPIVNIEWVIEDIQFEDTAFPDEIGRFNGAPNGAASGNIEAMSGTYNSPVIDWSALGVTSGEFRITRIVTDSCGQSSSDESEDFTL